MEPIKKFPPDRSYQPFRAMLDAELTSACFGFIVDPETAAAAHEAGVTAPLNQSHV